MLWNGQFGNSPESPIFHKSRTLYGLNRARHAIRREEHSLVTEGFMDALSLHLGGFPTAVAPLGTALTTVYRIYQDDARRVCDVPESFEIAALVPMGRPRGRFGVAPRRPAERVTYWDRFGNRREASS